ncbi:MAG: TIGR03905 family TSCPD domain-containing protein [Erysipelotrichaceae bacterium]
MNFEYTPKGVCSSKMKFEVEGDIIKNVVITGGCPGNLLGISRILQGKNYHEVIESFEGVRCGGKPTSCPDQIAQALKLHFQD